MAAADLEQGMADEGGGRGFSGEGTVVEILERGGERFAKIVLEPGTVLELPAPPTDISLGDRVIVDASLRFERVRSGEDLPHDVPPAHAPAAGGFSARARPAFRDYEHVLRVAGLFALAIVAFLAWRSWMVPADFGRYGHFRAGAIADAASLVPVYAGQGSCIDCHADVHETRLTGRHAAIACEACHEALGDHARGEAESAPVRPSPRAICLTCHAARAGLPKAFPRIVEREHSEAGPCTVCHKAHAPGLS
jgi:hypothetical protein